MTDGRSSPVEAGALAGWMAPAELGDRQLVARIFADALDLACLPGVDAGLRARLDRAGLPLYDLTPVQTWRRADGGGAPALAWDPRPAGWQPVSAPALDGLLAGRPVHWRDETTADHWHHDGLALLRLTGGASTPQVTGQPLSPAQAAALLAQRDALPALDVPLTQAALLAALPAAGYVPSDLRTGLVLAPLLAASLDPPIERPFRVEPDDIARFGRESGDMNPLHFDDEFARSLGFKGRIAHGMIFSNWLTRLLGTGYPGQGTIFLRSSSVFLAPVYPGQDYFARISAPIIDRRRGAYRIVAQVRDAAGAIAMVAYSDVMRRPDDA